jgi:bloom syndrome protein
MNSLKTPIDYLKYYFGYSEFRYPQEDIVKDALINLNQFILLPTGTGKSVCFQLPAIIQGGITIVISPLKSLIQDQLDNLSSGTIDAVGFYSDTKQLEKNEILKEMCNPNCKFKLIYTTPETIGQNDEFEAYLRAIYLEGRLTRFVIDEAHCISLWGNDFRTSYRRLSKIKTNYPNTPVMACTASATNQVKNDILHLLKLDSYKFYTKSYVRSNLNIIVKERNSNSLSDMILAIKGLYNGLSGIVYAISRKNCEKLTETLIENGIKADTYHAGLSSKQRILVQKQWKNNQIDVVVATIAFGMGIDKPDVRYVFHYNMPSSLENYYQEIGRAGRDGYNSDCILFYNYQDKIIAEKMIRENNYKTKNNQYIEHQISKLEQVVRYGENRLDCRHMQLSNYLGELSLNSCNNSCDNCKKSKYYSNLDISELGKLLVETIMSLGNKPLKSTIFKNIYKNNKFNSLKHKYNIGNTNISMLIDRLMVYLISNKYIKETLERNDYGFWDETYQLFNKSKNIINNIDKIQLPIDLGLVALGKKELESNVQVILENPIYKHLESFRDKCANKYLTNKNNIGVNSYIYNAVSGILNKSMDIDISIVLLDNCVETL